MAAFEFNDIGLGGGRLAPGFVSTTGVPIPIPVSASNPLFVGSFVNVAANTATPAGTSDSSGINGLVLGVEGPKDARIDNLPAATVGTAFVAISQGPYQIVTTGLAYTAAMIGSKFNLNAETATAVTATSKGDNFSKRRLDVSAAGSQFVAGPRVDRPGNPEYGELYVEIYASIDDNNFTPYPGA